jgi:hypothetical protein
MKHFISILFFTLLSVSAFCQAGNSGIQSYDHELRWLCDSASQTTFYRLDLYRPGQAAVTVGNYKPDGSAYTPTSTIKSGPCATGSTTFPDSSYTYNIIEGCDLVSGLGNDITFIRVMRIGVHNTTGASSTTILGNFNPATGAAYTVVGSVVYGYCKNWLSPSITNARRQFVSTSGTLVAGDNYYGVWILNVGVNTATLTINANTVNLLPGEEYFCNPSPAEHGQTISCNFGISYDCSVNGGTTLHVVQRYQ